MKASDFKSFSCVYSTMLVNMKNVEGFKKGGLLYVFLFCMVRKPLYIFLNCERVLVYFFFKKMEENKE